LAHLCIILTITALLGTFALSAAAQDDSGTLPWWNNRIFYEIFVRSFADSDGDGIGDLQGIIDKLDYLNDGDPATTDDLGVTGIWLMPIMPSPSYHGYDSTDYMDVNPDYGTLDDFRQLIREAHQRGIAVILDLVLNHTSSRPLWEYDRSYAKELLKKRVNRLYLPGVQIPKELDISYNLEEASSDKNLIVLATPAQFLRGVVKKINYRDLKNSILVSVSKGIEKGTLMTMAQMLEDVHPQLDENQIGVLSGPSHAEEVSRRIPTAVTTASNDVETAKTIQAAFMNSYFRVYSSTDILGVELGGAFKNVIAIGAGIIDGAGFGDNTKAAIMTRGVAEISRLGLAMGASAETFAGLSGMGDLIVTCMSRHSRNRYVGEQIGKGKKLKQILKSMEMVAEGIETSRSASQLAEKHNVETPITTEVYKILFEDKDPIKATTDLMTRDMKTE